MVKPEDVIGVAIGKERGQATFSCVDGHDSHTLRVSCLVFHVDKSLSTLTMF